MMNIGTYQINPPVALAPMAGITDKPFRRLCRSFGAGWAVGEMLTSDPSLRHTKKTLYRSDFSDETGVIAVQILGNDPAVMAEAARYNVALGAQVIDINMGCPAKKVCNVAAGSALMQNEALVAEILTVVVGAVDVPVTLKTRLGWADEHKNLPTIARIAEDAGIAALAVHGRTRTQMYRGDAAYDLIAEVKGRLNIPLWVNGDITSPQKAAAVLAQTGADGVMIGRGAQGQPWLFRDVKQYLEHGTLPPPVRLDEACATLLAHLQAMHDFYGERDGVRIARKHIGWYLNGLHEHRLAQYQQAYPSADLPPQALADVAFWQQLVDPVRRSINQIDEAAAQYDAVAVFLDTLSEYADTWACAYRG